MMASFWTILLVSCLVLRVGAKKGFILTAPKVLDQNLDERLCVTLYDVKGNGTVRVTLLNPETLDELTSSESQVTAGIASPITLKIPATDAVRALLNIAGEFDQEDYTVNATKEVLIRDNAITTFIQTDKGIYKPGQKVMLRVMPVDQNLRPLGHSARGNIWIEDPVGIRVAQWRDEIFDNGLIQKTIQLSKEPTLGTWSVHALVNDQPSIQTFEVNEYVLPKFEVNVIPPSYMLTNASEITWKVCAKYTYGQMVEGTVALKASFQSYSWEKMEPPGIEVTSEINGCYEHVLDIESLKNHTTSPSGRAPSYYYYRPISLFAEVTEKGTGVKINSSNSVTATSSPLQLTFLEHQKRNIHYRPGIPYFGKVQVTTPDGMPAPSKLIEFCLDSKFHQPLPLGRSENSAQFCRNFTSDAAGEIDFGIPPLSREHETVAIQLKAMDYPSPDYRIPSPSHLYPSTGSLFLMSYYSPSNSYIQIEPAKQVQCGNSYSVQIRMTGEEGHTYNLQYQVISRGHIVLQGSLPYSFEKAEIPSYVAEKYIIPANDTIGKLCRNNNCSRNGDSREQPLEVGEVHLPLEITSQFSPLAHLLIYYVHENGEIVADSANIQVSPCLENKVNLQFTEAEQYPGSVAKLNVEAAPSSLCGIGAVDKSVHLLSPGNRLTKAKISELLQSYDIPPHSQPQQKSYAHCKSLKPEWLPVPPIMLRPNLPGSTREAPPEVMDKRKRSFMPHYRHFSSNYADAITAFEDAGTLVISDMTLETRPCLQYGPYHYRPMAFGNTRGGLAGIGSFAPSVPATTTYAVQHPRPLVPKGHHESAKPLVAVRSDFRETWLWDLLLVGESGNESVERELPHSITEWVADGVCINSDVGLGVSDPVTIKAFQPFFISSTLPYSVIRGESAPVIVTVFNYLKQCLPVKVTLEKSENFTLLNDSNAFDTCVCGGKSITERFMIKPKTIGKTKVTVYVKATDNDNVCSNEIVKVNARDAATWELLVEAEGFPKEESLSSFFCPKDASEDEYSVDFPLFLPANLVLDSARATFSVSGDLLGPALKGLDKLVRLPTGCGEQNMVLFTPNIVVMDYLTSTNRLTPDIKKKALNNMKTGYQRELTYRHADGSYSAFGDRDPEGSLWLTAFVVRSFVQARRFIPIDENDLNISMNWVVSKQSENGCFPLVGKVLHNEMKGGLSKGHDSLAPLTAYTLISLLESGYQDEKVLTKAFSCLEAESDPSSYALGLFAYAAVLANHPSAEKFLEKLFEQAHQQGDLLFWKLGHSGDALSVEVETASYAILALVKQGGQDNLAKALPIVRWVARQRNPNGGFVSTQDTVVALQALAKYSSSFDSGILDMSVKAEADNLEQTFILNEDNRLLVQNVDVHSLPNKLQIKGSGSGCAYVQAVLKYNVQSTNKSQAFSLKVKADHRNPDDCSTAEIQTCIAFTLDGAKSNMVVIEVKMLSGYSPDKPSLKQLLASGIGLKRFEADGYNINFYFDELDSTENCFSFTVMQDVVVENLQPAIVRAYDYYEEENSVSASYQLDPTCVASER